MSFQDKSFQCSDCGTSFSFSVEASEIFSPKAMLTSQSAVPNAVRHGNPNVVDKVVSIPGVRYFR